MAVITPPSRRRRVDRRAPKSRARSQLINLRVNEDERARWSAFAESKGMSLGGLASPPARGPRAWTVLSRPANPRAAHDSDPIPCAKGCGRMFRDRRGIGLHEKSCPAVVTQNKAAV